MEGLLEFICVMQAVCFFVESLIFTTIIYLVIERKESNFHRRHSVNKKHGGSNERD